MPVSVCESSAKVDAALRESLGSSCTAAATADDANTAREPGDLEDLHNKLAASTKRILLNKLEYEEAPDHNTSVLETYKTKYNLLNSNSAANTAPNKMGISSNNNHNTNVRHSTPANSNNNKGSTNSNNNYGHSSHNGNTADTTHSTTTTSSAVVTSPTAVAATKQRPANPNELPQPKRVLYPRENVRIGWKNPSHKWKVGAGMMNVGNTCYLNSTLQALFHVPSMANWLMNDAKHMENCDTTSTSCIICAMIKTLKETQESISPIRPYFIYSKLKMICKNLVMGRQEDAHEFLRKLVEAMEESYLSRFRNYKELDQYSKETTPLNQILGGYIKTSVRCLSCNYVSVTFQHFLDLLVDIRKADSLEDALDLYFARERLEDLCYKCESCKKKVSATKQFSLDRAPIALCIALKRFSVLGGKINKNINIKARLDLSKYVTNKKPGETLTYRLVSMITHLGSSQTCGHYTAVGATESGGYYTFDDSYVKPINLQNAFNSSAYIVFYELDTAPRNISSTQVSSIDSKEPCSKPNGYLLGNNPTPQRIIGPQLPPNGINSYMLPDYNKPKGITSNGSLPNGGDSGGYSNGSKLSVNRHNSIPTGTNHTTTSTASANNNNPNSKITIHFKNNHNNVCNTNLASKSTVSSSTVTTTSLQQNGLNNNNRQLQNSPHLGTKKFQESAHSKPLLVSSPNKAKTAAASSEVESSCFSDAEDDINSTMPTTPPLPCMPILGDQHSSPTSPIKVTSQTNGIAKKTYASPAKNPLKSLVPYETESDDTDTSATDTKRMRATSTPHHLKRNNKTSSSSSSEDEDIDANKSSNGIQVKKIASTTTQSEASRTNAVNAINAIFSQSKNKHKTENNNNHQTTETYLKRNATNNNNSNNCNSYSNTFSKKQKLQTSTTTKSLISQSDSEQQNWMRNRNIDEHSNLKRSCSTPPSPPLLQTKTGPWQVVSLQPDSTTTSNTSMNPPKQVEKQPQRNFNNPFAKSPSKSDLFIRRPNKSNGQKRSTIVGNGYQRNAISDSAINELLKQTHRGYGAAVTTWNGDENEIEKEVKAEAREQRQRDWDDEAENDMDRGRQKKVKSYNKDTANRTPAYNPFQEQENNQRRWGYGNQRYQSGGGHFRHQLQQRNKFKFHRHHNKSQRFGGHHQRNNNHNHHNANKNFNRRDS